MKSLEEVLTVFNRDYSLDSFRSLYLVKFKNIRQVPLATLHIKLLYIKYTSNRCWCFIP